LPQVATVIAVEPAIMMRILKADKKSGTRKVLAGAL
jgi:hypothetical protein